jgi:putative ubiquitin-RnfH superfamily antitoxin RatB of RatAB toxin-antitoxin module
VYLFLLLKISLEIAKEEVVSFPHSPIIHQTSKSIDGKNITVANFITTRTVDVGDYPIENKKIQVGDRIEITKNLNGDVLNIRDENRANKSAKGNINDNIKQKSRCL